jgi:hypothetical protein
MAEKQLRDRIKDARDHIGLFTLLGAALGLVLKRYGVDWATRSRWTRPRARGLRRALGLERRAPKPLDLAHALAARPRAPHCGIVAGAPARTVK